MITFKTLREFKDYIPNCIVCEKPLLLSIKGYLRKRIGPLRKFQFKFDLKENILSYEKNSINIKINIDDNNIIKGQQHIENEGRFTVLKCCKSCDLKIQTSNNTNMENVIPEMHLDIEHLHYTLKGGKQVTIEKYYLGNIFSSNILVDARISIIINEKLLPTINFDFNKFKNLEQLNKRLGILTVFQ